MRALLLIFTLIAAEAGLWFAENRLGFHHFSLLRHTWYESFYFHHTPPDRAPNFSRATPPNYDPDFGWRNLPTTDTSQARGTANSEGWRASFEYAPEKTRPRIALFGDSFMFGTYLADDETVAARLRARFGDRYEVLDFSARGYGLDQMALVAEHAVKRYAPDILVVGFIAADLERSCFDFNFNARKPRFVLNKGWLELTGVPVPTPYETTLAHQSAQARFGDFARATLLRSRIVTGIGELLLRPDHRDCLVKTNAAIAKKLVSTAKSPAQVYFFHLDYPLPAKFEAELIATGAHYLSLPALGIDGARYADRHPQASLADRYAAEIFDALRSPQL